MSNNEEQQDMVTTLATNLHSFADSWRKLERWFEDNREAIQQALLGLPAYFADDVGAKDPSGVRARLLSRESLHAFMRHGWFPAMDMALSQIDLLAQGLDDPEEEKAASARQVFFTKFRAEVESIEQSLIRCFPRRSSIIRDAFQAHGEGKYNLSVPVFLAQADGIWYDRWGRHLFVGNRDTTVKKASDKLLQGGIIYEMTNCLSYNGWQLVLSQGQRPANFKDLNRHQVLHGEATEYGTEENSLKAISFLNFCGFILQDGAGDGSH